MDKRTAFVGADALIGPRDNVPIFGTFRRIRTIVLRADEGIGPYIRVANHLQIPICRIEERYRAGQGRNDYTYPAHDLAARPAGKFQFTAFRTESEGS